MKQIIRRKYEQKNVLLGVTCRSRLNNNSHILLLSLISIDRLLNTDNNNNQNSSAEVPNNNDHNEGEQSDEDVQPGSGYTTDSDSSDTAYDLLDYPAKDLPEDRLRDNIHNLREMLRHPYERMRTDEDIRQEFSERLQELKDEFQRRKDEGIIPEHETISESSSDSGDVHGDLNTSNTQSGGSADNGVDTSTATNNQSSTGSDSFSRVSNENSPDSFDNFVESDYLLDSLDSSILEFVILYLPYIIIVLLLLPFVFLLKRSKFL